MLITSEPGAGLRLTCCRGALPYKSLHLRHRFLPLSYAGEIRFEAHHVWGGAKLFRTKAALYFRDSIFSYIWNGEDDKVRRSQGRWSNLF